MRKPAGRRRRKQAAKGMARLRGGEFLMGTNDPRGFPSDGERPVRRVRVDPFFIGKCAVTNAEFEEFIRQTGYATEAERFGWSFVFHLLVPPELQSQVDQAALIAPWWLKVDGAFWKSPEGPGSNVIDRPDHPVVHVTWNDAVAYCEWSGARLPTEAEWEFAARGGLEQRRFPWGDELEPDGEYRCNVWQGDFPDRNTQADGFMSTAPARSFRANGFGLFNTSGNVWEWCADWFSPGYGRSAPRDNPTGPSAGSARVIRGGSYLCHDSYCNRYRVGARSSNTPDSSTGNMGFRVARGA
ncbi:MAG: formylglycine-generating enzyme family protein [Chloroflexi bacterium]|nr:formylglycine-generating enzyme family protein [Chloroflexota bacterium]